MRWAFVTSVAAVLAIAVASAAPQTPAAAQKALFDKYCLTCHSDAALKRGTVPLALDKLDFANVAKDPETWEKVLRKINAGVMPPPSSPHPEPAATKNLISWLTAELDRPAAEKPNPGRAPLLHRLNRTEYANAIRDVLSLEIDPATLLPPDDAAYGFDNISDALGLSPALQERYVSAAMKVAALAVGSPRSGAEGTTYRIPQDVSQDQHIEGLPLGTVGGIRVSHNFPVDGDYEFQSRLYRTNLNIMRGLESPHEIEFAIDGERIQTVKLGGAAELASLFLNPTDTGDAVDARLRVKVPVKAGPHSVTVTFLQEAQAEKAGRLQRYQRSTVDNFDWSGQPHIQTVTINGPFNSGAASDTPSRRRIFACRPATTADEGQCVRQIFDVLGQRAYRRPLMKEELGRIIEFFDAARKTVNFEAGIEAGLQRILASPQFLFRVEKEPAPGKTQRIGDYEMASRLSFFLWSSVPDDPLLDAASKGRLKDPAGFDAEVRRMLADPKSAALVQNFAGQWLLLRNLRTFSPNSNLFPDFDDNLRQAFRRETEMFFDSVMREDRNVLDLMTADYTFVNERLARHYGMPNVYGSQFRRVNIAEPSRRGLLGQGSFLAVTSHAERTSPVLRGKWILENVLGMPVPPPPANVPPLKERSPDDKPKTMREQMADHRANPTCANCHKIMDGIGFALENFDAVGSWRTRQAGLPIDASGELADGSHVDGVEGLRAALLKNPEMFVGTVTEKMMTYALGRGLDHRDMPTVRDIVRAASKDSYRFSSIVMGVVKSTPFQMRKASDEAASKEVADVRR